jgi:hypothetical protein
MSTILSILLITVLFALGISLVRWHSSHIVVASNSAGIHHGGRVTRTSVGAIATRYLVVKQSGTDLGVEACGATDHPLGIATDEAEDAGTPLMTIMPGAAECTIKVVPAVAILAGDVLYTSATGQVTNVPVAGCYIVGTALAAGNANEELEADPAAFGVPYKA